MSAEQLFPLHRYLLKQYNYISIDVIIFILRDSHLGVDKDVIQNDQLLRTVSNITQIFGINSRLYFK
jgi:hypothetical protein